ncbi:NUDIX hydrolase, partial [Marinitenerispora sediminis]
MATPEFILELRKRVGHDPLWLMGVTGVVLDAADRILLHR